MMKLDQRDLNILSALQKQGRMTKSALAQSVNLSPTPCWQRLERLEKAGLIEGYSANLCVAKIAPHTTVFMQAELISHQLQTFKQFEEAIVEVEEVLECWAVGGSFDFLIKFMVRDIDHYQRIVSGLLSDEIGLNRYYTYVVTRCILQRADIPLSVLSGATE